MERLTKYIEMNGGDYCETKDIGFAARRVLAFASVR